MHSNIDMEKTKLKLKIFKHSSQSNYKTLKLLKVYVSKNILYLRNKIRKEAKKTHNMSFLLKAYIFISQEKRLSQLHNSKVHFYFLRLKWFVSKIFDRDTKFGRVLYFVSGCH